MPKVRFEREDVVVDAKPGANLLEVAEAAGISVFRGMWPGLHCKRVHGWCNSCKVWVKSDSETAVNKPTGTERFPLRLNGRVAGTMRLACQVVIEGAADISVHTRAGGPLTRETAQWNADPAPSKWKDRWEKRNEKGAPADDEEDSAAES